MEKIVSTNLVSGYGDYKDPNSIFTLAHRTYTLNDINIIGRANISGIVENINLLDKPEITKIVGPDTGGTLKLTIPYLVQDIIIPEDSSGLSINLNPSTYKVSTTTNIYKKL